MIYAYNKNEIRKVIYNLKKQWGVPVAWYQMTSSGRNLATGKLTISWQVIKINRGILLPSDVERISKIIAVLSDSKYQFGASIDIDTRFLLLDKKDMPSDFQFDEAADINDKLIINAKRYVLSKIVDFDHSQALLLKLKHIKGQLANEQFDEEITQAIAMEHSNEATLT